MHDKSGWADFCRLGRVGDKSVLRGRRMLPFLAKGGDNGPDLGADSLAASEACRLGRFGGSATQRGRGKLGESAVFHLW